MFRSRTFIIVMALLGPVAAASSTYAAVNLEFRLLGKGGVLGQTAKVGLFANSTTNSNEPISEVQMVFEWDETKLEFLGLNPRDSIEGLISVVPPDDIFGINEADTPADGDGLYLMLANTGTPIEATPAGVLLTTFEFTPLTPTESTAVSIASEGGDGPLLRDTSVWGGRFGSRNMTGQLVGTDFPIVIPEPASWSVLAGVLGLMVVRRRR